MKTKKAFQTGALMIVDLVACPLHMAAQLTSNVAQLAADGIAMGEGYISEKIDNNKYREDVANYRVNYTKQRFMQTAHTLEYYKNKLQASIDKANNKINDIKAERITVVHTAEIVPVEHYEVMNSGEFMAGL